MYLEQVVPSDQLHDHLIAGVVQLVEFLVLVRSALEDLLLLVLLHVVKQLEKQLADTQILADHLSFFDRMDVVQVRLLPAAVFQEVLDLSDLFSHSHHSMIRNFLDSLTSSEPQILSELDNFGVEGECEKQVFFEFIVDFHDFEAVLGDVQSELQILLGVFDFTGGKFFGSGLVDSVVFYDFFHFCLSKVDCVFFLLFQVQAVVSPTDVHEGSTVDVSSFFLGCFQLDHS